MHSENAASDAVEKSTKDAAHQRAAEDGAPGRCRLESVEMQWGGIAVDSGGGWEDFCRDHDGEDGRGAHPGPCAE
jgi:hypothetical protein